MSSKTGTREWAGSTVNCVKGCEHDCLYCYARHNAVDRFDQIKPDQWTNMRVDHMQVNKRRGKRRGLVMFPSSHDITPSVLPHCMTLLRHFINAGNQMLVVTKPHLEVVKAICDRPWSHDIVFRFSIGMVDDDLRKLWEPGAPSVQERLDAMQHAHEAGFGTSVSAEPLLEPWNALQVYLACEPFLSKEQGSPAGEFWIGKLNRIRDRVRIKSTDQRRAMEKLIQWQTDQNVMHIVQLFRHHGTRHVRWKDSYKQVIERAR
jgi:DNA repair photolyase